MPLKFEKWDQTYRLGFVESFAKAYNKAHRKHFKVTDESLVDEQDYDFRLFDRSGSVLKIQHTQEGANDPVEHQKPAEAGRIIDKLQRELAHLKGVRVYLNFKATPKKGEPNERFTHYLECLIREKACIPNRESSFSYDGKDRELLKEVENHIDRMVVRTGGENAKISFSYGTHKVKDVIERMKEAERLRKAIESKMGKYSDPRDLVLLVQFDILPFVRPSPSEIKKLCSETKFKGIWIFDSWGKRFHRIK